MKTTHQKSVQLICTLYAVRSTLSLVVLLGVGVLAAGCSRAASIMVTRVASITADEDVCKKSVEVHLVGVNRFEKDQWESMSMTEYWQPDNQLRKSARDYTYVIQFGQEPCQRILGKKDPIRKTWKSRKAEYLFVLADLPGIFPDMPGSADARRLQLPALDSASWGWQKQINIAVKSSNLVPLAVPTSEPK